MRCEIRRMGEDTYNFGDQLLDFGVLLIGAAKVTKVCHVD